MRGNKVLVGVYTYIDDALQAISFAKRERLDYRVYSPVPHHELEEATMPEKSPVRFITGIGAVTGLCFGFGLAIWSSLDYPLRVSAKDIASIPGFVVIGYECTILFGGLATLFALLIFCRLPDFLGRIGFDPRFSQDKFGVVIGCPTDQVEVVRRELESKGADEVQVKEGL
jgi:hypothetical protein